MGRDGQTKSGIPSLQKVGTSFGFDVTDERRVFDLDGGNRYYCVGTLEGRGRRFAETDVLDLALTMKRE